MASTLGGRDVVASVRRRSLRFLTAAVTAAVAALYVAVFLVQLPHLHELDNPAPVYAALAAVYAVGAVLVALRDQQALLWTGATVQVVLLTLFFWLLAGLYAHGEESFILDMLGLAIGINAAQVVLLGLLSYLAGSAPRQRAA